MLSFLITIKTPRLGRNSDFKIYFNFYLDFSLNFLLDFKLILLKNIKYFIKELN